MSNKANHLQVVPLPNYQGEVVALLRSLLADAEKGLVTGLAGVAHYGRGRTAKFGNGSCTDDVGRTMDDLMALLARIKPE